MPERKRSQDGCRETDDITGADGSVSQAGRAGGRLAGRIGSRDEKKRSLERPAGATRVTKSVEEED
ncbi:hypothetical protein [Pseudoruegeria sp. HB172150]|uniref:hypothetical protein n=1 Tax=Pseudoruegeria sp. HB172150 TaxID=2721164 RepID=UPI001555E146|nr:hypothetical protein [Pseudoruegeria sp. HB172150]